MANALRDRELAHYLDGVMDGDLHIKRVQSLASAVAGAMKAAELGVTAIGRGLAEARNLKPRYAVKQIDRLLSNDGIDLDAWFPKWVAHLVSVREAIVVALDWTDFDRDDQSTLALHLITRHGRATPLMWTTVIKSALEGWRNAHEDALLMRFGKALPEGVQVTLLADRGFGDSALYALLDELGFDFVIRFRECIQVTDAAGQTRTAAEWVSANGRAKHLIGASVTGEKRPIPAVVCVKAKAMKDAWCLAVGNCETKAADVIKLYGKRFTIEESFRDIKNLRFGMGLSTRRIGQPVRRDRLLLIGAVAAVLLTLLGAASERVGYDRDLRVNTVKTRTHSLFFQGTYYYAAIANMSNERLEPLMKAYDEILREHAAFRDLFGIV